MQITFPRSPWSGSYQNFFYQAALASLPLVVDLVATRLLKPYCRGNFSSPSSVESISSTLSITSLYTLVWNQPAFNGGCAVVLARIAYKFYSAYNADAPHSNKPPEQMAYIEPQFITPAVQHLGNLIERQWINQEEIYQMGGAQSIKTNLQSFDALTELSKLQGDANRARKAGAIFKSYFKQLEVPLFEPIFEDLRNASMAVNKPEAYRAAIAKLDENRKQLAIVTLRHLHNVSQQSAQNKMTTQKLAAIFEPILFKMKALDLPQGKTESAFHIVMLIDLIENLF